MKKMDSFPPSFLTQTYDMVDDSFTNAIVSWSPTCCNSFVVWDFYEFSQALLPQFFKHNNFSSFVRQLNTYGFRKSDPDRWEFSHEEFIRNQRHKLQNIHRKRSVTTSNSAPASAIMHAQAFDLNMLQQAWTVAGLQHQPTVPQAESEVQQLIRERNVMVMGLGRLNVQQHSAHEQIKCISDRLLAMEMRQQQMVAFVAHTMSAPTSHYQYGNQVSAVNLGGAQQKLLADCLSDSDCIGARKRRRIMYNDQCQSENVVADCSMDYSQTQQQFSAEGHASSCEINQETATSVTTTSDDQEMVASYDPKRLVELNFESDSDSSICMDNLNIQGVSNESQNLVIQSRLYNQNVGAASIACSGMLDEVKMKTRMSTKRPAISEGCGLSLESEEHLQMMDLNLQPLSIADGFQYFPTISQEGSRDGPLAKCIQASASNTFFEDLESELFWEHLLSLPVSMQAELSVGRSASGQNVSCFGLIE